MTVSEPAPARSTPGLTVIASWLAGLAGWRRALIAFGLGAVSVLTLAPFHIWPLLAVTFPALIWMLDGIAEPARMAKPRWRQAAILGWWHGCGYFLGGLYWIGYAFFVEADKFAWLAPLGAVALPAALAIFHAMAAALAMMLWRSGVTRIFIFAAAFFAMDWLRGHILTGFPWNLWGYALAGNDALGQVASLVGIYGLTLLAVLIFASPAALAGPSSEHSRGKVFLPAVCLVLLALGWAWGTYRISGTTSELTGTKLRIVQANIPQAEKWKPENRQWIFERLFKLSRDGVAEARPTHLIWPETSVPVLFALNGNILHDDVRQAFADLVPPGGSFIFGAERVEGTKRADGRYDVNKVFNTLFVLGEGARIAATYDKVHLVPFGEYLPFEAALTAVGIKQLTHANTGFASGTHRPLMTTPAAPPFVPLICYEAIFPGYGATEARPGWLLNLTNDAWFGSSTGPYQHLHQSRVRAIEEGLPLIRAANTGISAVIDAHGRILASLPLDRMGVIDHSLPVALPPPLYARWRELCLMLVAIAFVILYRITIKVERLSKYQA